MNSDAGRGSQPFDSASSLPLPHGIGIGANPVLQEEITIHLSEGGVFRAYFFSLVALASVECLLVFFNHFDPQVWTGRATLFHLSAAAAAALAIYLSLRVGNQEFVRRSRPLGFWFHQRGVGLREVATGQIGFLAVHSLLFAAVSFPLLLWPAAVARTAPAHVQTAVLLILFYSLVYGMWGLVASTFWLSPESRQFFTRCLFGFFVFLSGLFHLSLNPIAYLLFHLGWAELGRGGGMWGLTWSPAQIHFFAHLFLLVAALFLYLRGLKREVYP
jgi:hypothetical protein